MATYTWPDPVAEPWRILTMSWALQHNSRTSVSPLNGATQTLSLPGARWRVTLDLPARGAAANAELEAFINRLSGQEHRVALGDLTRRRPRGSIAASGVTVSTAAAQFTQSLTLAGAGAGATLLAGDWLAVGGQLLQVAAGATASAGGVITVEIRPMLRAAVAAGAAVTVLDPRALFVLASPVVQIPRAAPGQICPALSLDLVEVFS